MKKLALVVLTLGVLLLGATASRAANLYVDPFHVPDAVHFPTISGALTAAHAAGDTIYVKSGTYIESVLVSKEVKIVGTAGKYKTVVQPPATGWNDSIGFVVISKNVLIQGFTIRGGANAWGMGVCIGLWPGVGSQPVDNVRVLNCIVERSRLGIAVLQVSASQVVSNIKLAGNQIRSCSASAGGATVGTGIYVASNDTSDITNVVISGNQIADNDLYGILVQGTGGSPTFAGMVISGNTLVNNGALDAAPNAHNLNRLAIGFDNAFGTITMSKNKILLPSSGIPVDVIGGPPVFQGTGNRTFTSSTVSTAGLSAPLALP